MVGDFNGGFTSTDLAGDPPYMTLSTNPDFGSGDPSEAITSSPAWNPISNTAWFGIASTSAPRLISFNPSTNSAQVVGKGTITGAVWSPTPLDATSGDVFNTDWGGNAYRWNSSGTHIQSWVTPKGAGHVISNMAIARDNNGNDHLAWIDMNGQVDNAISPSGSFWVETSGITVRDAMDPSFVRSSDGSQIGEGFVDASSGTIYYSLNSIPANSTMPHLYGSVNQSIDSISGSWLNAVFDADLGQGNLGLNSATYTWSDDAQGSPGILIYLMAPVSLEMEVYGPSGLAYGSYSQPHAPITGRPGDQETITAFAPGLSIPQPGDAQLVIHATGFPDFTMPNYQSSTDPMAQGGSNTGAIAFYADNFTLPTSTTDYSMTLTETLWIKDPITGKMVQANYPSPTMTINVPVVGVASPGNLTLSSYHDGNIDNSGINAGGYPNLVTGNPLKFNFGDTMMADLVVSTPPPPAGERFYSSVLNGTIVYPINTPKPTGTAQIMDNLTDASTKTVSFSNNTRAGNTDNGVSTNDSVASFPVEWPTWRPPISKVIPYDWQGTLKATWTQTVVYEHQVCTDDGHGGQSCIWVPDSPVEFTGTTDSQLAQRTGTDIYYIPSAREPWMR